MAQIYVIFFIQRIITSHIDQKNQWFRFNISLAMLLALSLFVLIILNETWRCLFCFNQLCTVNSFRTNLLNHSVSENCHVNKKMEEHVKVHTIPKSNKVYASPTSILMASNFINIRIPAMTTIQMEML